MSIDWGTLVLGPNIAIFGQPVGYLSATYGQANINAIFDEAYLQLDPLGRGPDGETFQLGSPGGVTTAKPVIGIRLSDLPFAPDQGDRVMIGTDTYVVKEVRADGKGGAKLLLNAA